MTKKRVQQANPGEKQAIKVIAYYSTTLYDLCIIRDQKSLFSGVFLPETDPVHSLNRQIIMIINNSDSIVLAGIGSAVLSDAKAGLQVVEMAKKRFAGHPGIVFRKLATGGMDLLYAIEGFERVVLVESRHINGIKSGSVITTCIGPSIKKKKDEVCTGPEFSQINTLLEFGNQCGCRMPENVLCITVTSDAHRDFGENVSDSVKMVLNKVMKLIEQQIECWSFCNA